MLSASVFLACCVDALQLVFGVTVCGTRAMEECLGAGQGVASLLFSGDVKGRVILRLPETQIASVMDHLCRKYNVGGTVDAYMAFSEMLNMYAAHLSAGLAVHGVHVTIGPPEPVPEAYAADAALHIELKATTGWLFALDYLFDMERSPICLS